MEVEEIVERLANYSERLRTGSLYRAHSLWTIWQSYNDAENPLRANDVPRHRGSTALNILASAALHETIMIIARALDHSGRGNVLSSNRVSFPVMVELMKLDGVREALIRKAEDWLPDGFRAQENADSARRAMDEFVAATDALRQSEPSKRLRDFRDEFLAHNLEFEEERKRPIIKNVTDILAELTQISEMASLAFEGASIEWEFAQRDRERDVTSLWKVIEKGARLE